MGQIGLIAPFGLVGASVVGYVGIDYVVILPDWSIELNPGVVLRGLGIGQECSAVGAVVTYGEPRAACWADCLRRQMGDEWNR